MNPTAKGWQQQSQKGLSDLQKSAKPPKPLFLPGVNKINLELLISDLFIYFFTISSLIS